MELFKLLGTIAIDNAQANDALDQTAGKAEKTNGTMSDAFSKIGKAGLAVGKAVVGAGAAAGTAWVAAIEGSREYRAQMGLLDGAFEAAGHSSEEAKNTYSQLNAVLGDTEQAVEAAQHIALIADNEKEMNELTHIGAGVFQSFGASLPLEGLFEAVNHTASLGEVQGSLADALEWSGITVEEFNDRLAECTSEEERQDLIMKTLKDTYGEAGEQYKETNKDVIAAREANERLTDAFSKLGEVGEPILTIIKDKISEFVTAAVPHLENLIQKVKDVKTWIADNEQTIMNWGAAIAGASVTIGLFLLVLNWSKILTAAKTAIMGVRGAVILFNAALRANPIGLVVSLLAGLVTAFIILWNENEAFRKFWLDMWDRIKSACGSAVNWIKEKFGEFKEMIKTVGDTFGEIKDNIVEKLEDAWETVSGIIDKIKGFFPLDIGEIFSNIKIPKITVSGGEAPYGIAGHGKLPSFGVKWNAQGAVFDQPTIFSTRQGFQGVGEAGPEAVAPVATLQAYINDAVKGRDESLVRTMIEQNRMMMDFLKRIVPHDVRLNSGALVGELIPAIDTGLSDRYAHAMRGNVR